MPAFQIKAWLRLVLALLLACQAWVVRADVFRPAYLELREAGAGRYDVLWKVPALAKTCVWRQPCASLRIRSNLRSRSAFSVAARICSAGRFGARVGLSVRRFMSTVSPAARPM